MWMWRAGFSIGVGLLFGTGVWAAETIMLFDFTAGTHGWHGSARVRDVHSTDAGLQFRCTLEEDPWIEGPVAERLPSGVPVRVTVRARTNGDENWQLFYGQGFSAERVVSFEVPGDGVWHDVDISLPPLPERCRLRIDPGHHGGTDVTVAFIKAQPTVPLPTPELTAPGTVSLGPNPVELRSGALRIVHSRALWGGFRVYVADEEMAVCPGEPRIGCVVDEQASYLPVEGAYMPTDSAGRALVFTGTVADPAGATWRVTRQFEAEGRDGASGRVTVTTSLTVDRPRQVYHVPWVTMFAGLGTFGGEKTQALLPGVEYLADEPSSSEADVRGAGAIRRIVDDVKLCFPMMSLCHRERYLGLAWDRSSHPAAVFDTPDRMFGTGSHLMGLWFPGVGMLRDENQVSAHAAHALDAGEHLTFSFTIFGGRGSTIVPAVQHYVRMHPLPPVPEPEGGLQAAVRLLAHGWLDSAAHEDGLWRHAVWGDRFKPQPAADAVTFMKWLAATTADRALAARLDAGAARGLARLEGRRNAGVSHVRLQPVQYLVLGGMQERLRTELPTIERRLAEFPADGVVPYRQREGHPDYGATHFANHANGLAAVAVTDLVEYASWTGHPGVIARTLDIVDRLTALYAGTVPRGAQTWEMPLHTPDILASGRLVHIYVLCYLISGDSTYLDQARYWAWTGVPFTYIDAPVEKPVGVYATTAVLGATNWRAPYWIGQPVQWCGLVYRSALEDLARVDRQEGELWTTLAAGMTRAGLQMTFPLSDEERQGLLPDFFFLRRQVSAGPAINPGTVQAGLAEAYGAGRIRDLCVVGPDRLRVHAPGSVTPLPSEDGAVRAQVDGWPRDTYWVHVAGLETAPKRVLWNGAETTGEYTSEHRALTLAVRGRGLLEIRQ